jgi:hypothetical protein
LCEPWLCECGFRFVCTVGGLHVIGAVYCAY